MARGEAIALRADPFVESRSRDPAATLPSWSTTFVGRRTETAVLAELLTRRALVTITGVGGVGKTRLAAQVVTSGSAPAGRCWWFDLGPLGATHAVDVAVADGMGLPLLPGAPAVDQLVEHLASGGPSLLVFDNCEHVADAVAALCARIPRRCPDVTLLATSRVPLDVDGEHVVRLSPLAVTGADEERCDPDLAPALELFRDRARAAGWTDAEEGLDPAVQSICERLGGIPLAIELAAARAGSMPLVDLDAALATASRELVVRPHAAVPHHRSIDASLRWSLDLLDDDERVVFRRLGVFPGPFDSHAASAVAGEADDDPSVRVHLAHLVDHGLVELVPARAQYRLLTPVREFARDVLAEANELDATAGRYATYWTELAMRAGEWGPGLDFPLLEASLTDVLHALEWCARHQPDRADEVLGAIAPAAFGLGRWSGVDRACDWVLADRPRGDHWPMAVGSVAICALMVNRFDVLALVDVAREQAERVGDRPALHRLATPPAWLAGIVQRDLQPSRQLVDAAVSDGELYTAAMTATALATTLGPLGQLDELDRTCDLVERICDEAGHELDHTAGGPMRCLGLLLRGRSADAVTRLPDRVFEWRGISCLWAGVRARIGVACADRSLVTSAGRFLRPDDGAAAITQKYLVAWAEHVVSGALRPAADALAAGVGGSLPGDDLELLGLLTTTLLAAGDLDRAAERVAELEALVALFPEPAPLPRARAELARARLALAGDDLVHADQAAHGALTTASQAGLALTTVDALETVAEVVRRSGRPQHAARLLGATAAARAAIAYVDTLGSPVAAGVRAGLAADEPDAWATGERLDLPSAVAAARTGRGPRGRPSFGVDALTATELEVARQIARGDSNPTIAAELLVSLPTVKTHVAHILDKLGLRNRAEVAVAMERHRAASDRTTSSR